MPFIARNTIMDALEALIKQQPAFKTVDRKLRMWDQLSPQDQPACFLVVHDDEYMPRGRGTPRRLMMNVVAWVMARTDDATGGEVLSDLIDALEDALAPDPGSVVCTLGGLVNRAFMEGKCPQDPGDLDGQALALVPIKIIVP